MKTTKTVSKNEEIPKMKEKEELKPITSEEQAISARVMAENREWATIREDDCEDFSLMKDPFELPPPALKKQEEKEFFFRWITRDPKRLDEMRSKQVPFRYWICNSTNTPFLKGFFDPVLGCVSREDQMLVFKKWWMHLKERQFKEGMAQAQDSAGDITKRNGDSDGNYTWKAGSRSIESEASQTEIKGSDLIIEDIKDYTPAGIPAGDADLIAE
jgi:hypothetical protein